MIAIDQTSAKMRANDLVRRKYSPGMPRRVAKRLGRISSEGTRRDDTQCLKNYLEWRDLNSLPIGEQDNRRQMVVYLEERAEVLKQSSLNQIKVALQHVYGIRLPQVESEVETILSSRSYSPEEFARVVLHQCDKNGLASLLAFSAGIRAHEAATLRRANELMASPSRSWDSRRFAGVADYQLYVVTGKGGLRREVAVPTKLAEAVELRRYLDKPRQVIDREIFYEAHYDIGFGQAFSQSFTDASVKALGYSNGAHGLRHSYVKIRTTALQSLGYSFHDAQCIVSQEVGHFRPSITIAYYR